MRRTRIYLILCIALFILGYTGGLWGNQWYLETGNSYFHFLGGLAIALLVASYYATQFSKLSQPFRFFCILGITVTIGTFWEFHEYILNNLVGSGFQGDLDDTMKDLLLDTLGGVLGAVYSFRWRNH